MIKRMPSARDSRAVAENGWAPIFLSVVMPAYNEAGSIEQVILDHAQLLASIPNLVARWEILCLDDASTDGTWEILQRLGPRVEQMTLLRHRENQGITASFADLYAAAQGTHLYATASDGQWPAANLLRMLDPLRSGGELVVGERLNRRQVYSLRRWIVSILFNRLPWLLFGVETVDAGSVKLGVRGLFTMKLVSCSPFVEAERIIVAKRAGYHVAFVPIEFLPRASGRAEGARWGNVRASARDALRCVQAYGLGTRSPGAWRSTHQPLDDNVKE